PEIVAEPVRAPIIIVGLPRTGTTVLHALLAQDPENRVPMTWEVMHPWPAPERATYDTDPRIAQVERHCAGVGRIIPGFKSMHPMGALLPQECVALTAHEFATMIYHTANRVPSYQRWLDGADLRWVYRAHRRWLQFLQWRCPGERWVLKSPGHLWALDALLGEYPDVRIVQTHRDPLKVVASLASLVTVLRSMASDEIDAREIGADWTARLADGLARGMAARVNGLLPPSQVLDVQFHDLMRDEIATVRQIYSHFGLTLSASAEERMRAFLAANPREKHGAHRYALSAAGLDEATERRRYAAYEARFAIPPEPADCIPTGLCPRAGGQTPAGPHPPLRSPGPGAGSPAPPQAVQSHHFRGRLRRELVGLEPAAEDQPLATSRGRDPVRHAGIAMREHHPEAAVCTQRRLRLVQRDAVVAVVERLHVPGPGLDPPVGAGRDRAGDHERLVGLETEGAERVDVVGRAPARHVGAPRHRRSYDVRRQLRQRHDVQGLAHERGDGAQPAGEA